MKFLFSFVFFSFYDVFFFGNILFLEEIDNIEVVDMEFDDDDNVVSDNIFGKLVFVLIWEFIFFVCCFMFRF